MGGYTSGRYRTRNAGPVEAAQCVDVRRLRRMGLVKAGARTVGTLRWSTGGRETGSANVSVDLTDPAGGGWLVLSYAVKGSPRRDTVAMVAHPMRFGGWRFYMTCPAIGRRCEVLAFAHGRWASLRAQRLAYASQSEDQLGRLHRRRRKAEARALGTDGYPRPRGAKRKELLEAWTASELELDQVFAAEALRRFGPRFARLGLRYPDEV